ncbi:IS66 family insertion sequence element accessory protein TnpB [Variovorax sp. GT1P44]|uniref:IS66 family insertion sequence element accessory protein TnpB n=1 Tax=Variovorax sp. GT1P44 TaxID=3443742 RepID=UPI003F453A01
MIRIDAMARGRIHGHANPPGPDRLLMSVVRVFGAAQAYHGYVFANARATRNKLLIHDGFGIWCAAGRLDQGRFSWRLQARPVHSRLSRKPVRCTRPWPHVAASGADATHHARVVVYRFGGPCEINWRMHQ